MANIFKQLETHLGSHGITGVKAHTAARRVGDAIGARAFTAGEAVIFTSYANDRKTPTLSHELSHTVQQGQRKPTKRAGSTEAVSVKVKSDGKSPLKVEWTYTSKDKANAELEPKENPTGSDVKKAVESLVGDSQPSGI